MHKFLISLLAALALANSVKASINPTVIKEQIDQNKFEKALSQIDNSIISEEENPLNYLYRGIVYLHLANFYWENNDFENTLEPNQKGINDFNKALDIYNQSSNKNISRENLPILFANKGHALYSLAFNLKRKERKETFKQSFDAFSNYIELAPLVTESNNKIYEISPPKFYYRVLFDEGKYEYTKSQAFLDRAIVNSYAGLKKSKSFCSDLKESKKLGNIQAKELVRLNC